MVVHSHCPVKSTLSPAIDFVDVNIWVSKENLYGFMVCHGHSPMEGTLSKTIVSVHVNFWSSQESFHCF